MLKAVRCNTQTQESLNDSTGIHSFRSFSQPKLHEKIEATGFKGRCAKPDLTSSGFMPFINERDHLGRLLTGDDDSKKRASSVPKSQAAITMREFFSTKYTKHSSFKTDGDHKNDDDKNFHSSRAFSSSLANLLFLEDNPAMRESYFKNKENHNKNLESYIQPISASINYQNFMHNRQFREYYEQTKYTTILEAAARLKSIHSDPNSSGITARSNSCAFRRVDRETNENYKKKELLKTPKIGLYDLSCYSKIRNRAPEVRIPKAERRNLESSQVGWKLTSDLDYLEDEDQTRLKISGKHLPAVDISRMTERVDIQQPNKFAHKIPERRKSPVNIEEMKKEMQFMVYIEEKYYKKAVPIPIGFQVKDKNQPLSGQEVDEKIQRLIEKYKIRVRKTNEKREGMRHSSPKKPTLRSTGILKSINKS